MKNFFSVENIDFFKKILWSTNKTITVVFVFFIIYRVNSFLFYLNFFEFFLYISFVFLAFQIVCLVLSFFLFSAANVVYKFSGNMNIFSKIYNFIDYGGYAVCFFSFIFSIERVFVEQSWLNSIHVTEMRRVIFELSYGICIFLIMVCLGVRKPSSEIIEKKRPVDKGPTRHQSDSLNRRLFLTSSASAVAAATVGSRIIMRNNFDPPSNNAYSGKSENRKNVLLVTFDALSASDMSVYGYGLNTTPHIDIFAKSSDMHSSFYTCSTFTTPGLSSILTGRYPSESRIFQLGGMLHGQDTYRTLPAILKTAGYKTAMVCGNPYAMPLLGSTHGAFDHLLAAPRTGWTDLAPSEFLELSGTMDMVDLADRMVTVSGLVLPALRQGLSETPPRATFEAAKKLISEMEEPFFIWIHVMAPHAPYLPSEEFRHRFLKPGLLEARQDMLHPRILDRTKKKSQIQTNIEHLRLRYNEWVLEADSAFGEFMAFMGQSGVMKDTMTMVSADHGEFFTPDSFGHGGDVLHQSLIHIPMILKMPGQRVGRRINTVADQTSIAPTILDAAGLSVPQWMTGSSLISAGLGEGGSVVSSGLAVTQYLEKNSSFEPITTGTIGAVTEGFQYVRTLATGEEKLYVMEDMASAEGDLEGERYDVKGDMRRTLESIRGKIKERFPEMTI